MSQRTCTLEDCDRPHLSRGYCGPHYRRHRLYGDPLAGHYVKKPQPPRLCTIEGCGRRRYANGLCPAHAARQAKHGDPNGGRAGVKLGIERPFVACGEPECDDRAQAHGLCWSHLNRQRYQADPSKYAAWAAAYRARQVGATVEDFTALEIFERDRWTCGLCSKKIRQTLTYPHPRSASLDHVVPLSRGGEHSRSNSQASHLDCNRRKGNRGGQQLALLG